jgi:hypothetical protein
MSTLHTAHAAHRVSRVVAVSAVATVLLTACSADSGTAPLTPAVDAALAARTSDGGRVTHYDILDWVLAQGSYCARPEHRNGPECAAAGAGLDVSGWFDPVRGLCGVVDYAGVATRYIERGGGRSLGTTYDGSVTERLRNDGLAEVTITLRTETALALAQPCEGVPFSPVLFGAVPADILAGAEPAVGSSFFSITYVAPPGYPLPEPVQIYIGEPPYELVKIAFHADATGPLHSASGFAEGTVGRLHIQQVGRITPGLLNREGDYPNDVFPVENVTLQPVAR